MDHFKKIGAQFLQLFSAEKEAEIRALSLQIAAHLQQPTTYQHKWEAQRWTLTQKTLEQKLQSWKQLKTEYNDLEVLAGFISTGEYDSQKWTSRFQEWKLSFEAQLPLLQPELTQQLPSCLLRYSVSSTDQYYPMATEAEKMLRKLESAEKHSVILLDEARGYSYHPVKSIVIAVLAPFSFAELKDQAGQTWVQSGYPTEEAKPVSVSLEILPVPFSTTPPRFDETELSYEIYPVRIDHTICSPISSLWGRLTNIPTQTTVEVNQFKDSQSTAYFARILLAAAMNRR